MSKQPDRNEVVEIRRYRFRAHIDLRPYLQGVRFREQTGGEYQINPEDYPKAVGQLERARVLYVRTARDVQRILPRIRYREVRAGVFRETVGDPERWTYLSPVVRRWRRCLSRDKQLLLRAGWTLAYHPSRGRTQFHLIRPHTDLDECRMRGDEAILQGYAGVLGTLPVPFWESDKYLTALWPGYVIPKQYERFLVKTMSPLDEPLSTDEETYWIWHPSDRAIIENTIKSLKLRFVPWDIKKDWVQTASIVMRRAYGQYFNRRNGGKELQAIVRQRAWHEIEDVILRETVKKLCQAEWEGENAASAFLHFISDQLCVELNWHDYGKELEAWVIESSPVLYGHRVLENRYYRLVVPHFETVVGWQTRRHPEWEGEARPRVRLYHWRSLPVVGRLKTAPKAEEPIPGVAGGSLEDLAQRSLLGIPRVEWDLAKQLTVGAFILDLDGAHWRGCHDLCRYFYGYGRIIRRGPVECDGYGLLLEDALGHQFALDTNILMAKDLWDDGEWVQFVAISSLLHHQAWLQLKRDIPVFEVKIRALFRRAYERVALRHSLLAMVKYHFGISEDELKSHFTKKWQATRIDDEIRQLLKDGDILEYRRKLYYRYSDLDPNIMQQYLEGVDKAEFQPFHMMKTLLHPLFVRSLNLRQEAELVKRRQLEGVEMIGVSAKMTDKEMLSRARSALENRGIVRIGARGRQKERGILLVDLLQKANPNLLVRRRDSIHTFSDQKKVDQISYLIRDPFKQLKIVMERKRK